LDFLSEARRIGFADETVVFTNGTLLHRMPAEFYPLVDRIWVSVYPGVRHKVDWPECSRLCMDHGVTLDVRRYDDFTHSLVNHPIEDPALLKKIFKECTMVGKRGCPSVHEGRFYSCCTAPFIAPRLARMGVAFDNRDEDGVPLHGNPRLRAGIEALLEREKPLKACTYCLGTSGPLVRHRQLDAAGRSEWLKEDDRAKIAGARRRLLGS
jgi:hypothetical protein